jgi:hypothetical protein
LTDIVLVDLAERTEALFVVSPSVRDPVGRITIGSREPIVVNGQHSIGAAASGRNRQH